MGVGDPMRAMARRATVATSFAVLASWSPSSAAQDQWSQPSPGVSLLLRTAPGPLRLHAAVVDLDHEDLYIRATRPDERGRTTTNFAQHVGAVVAINGDWFAAGSFQPHGLAVGQGVHWEGTADEGWAFIACTIERECVFGDHPVNAELYWRWFDVVGGNGWRLVVDGQVPNYPPDAFYSALEPRSAVGMSQDGKTMFFVVVEGRRADSVGIGFAQLGTFMKELGAHQALMLDGGGSSALVVNQARVSQLPSNQGSERVVANHLAIVRGQPDPRCATTPNGRYCEGTVIHTCQGGAHQGEGDCGFFGATCDVTSDGVGVCTHLECIHGPEQSYCESDTIIRTCSYGRPDGSGDCSAFGATCENGGHDAYCVHFECIHGGNARWCDDAQMLRACVDGQPSDPVDCSLAGQVCSDTAGACIDAVCAGRENERFCVDETEIVCDTGIASEAGPCGADEGTGGSSHDDDDDDDRGGDGSGASGSSNEPSADEAAGCGCVSGFTHGPPWLASTLLGLFAVRRRRARAFS